MDIRDICVYNFISTYVLLLGVFYTRDYEAFFKFPEILIPIPDQYEIDEYRKICDYKCGC